LIPNELFMELYRSTFLRLFPFALAARSAEPSSPPLKPGLFDVAAYGAKGDGKTLDTDKLQAAIDAAAAAGGGRVYLHNGIFLSGALRLRSNVTLHIESGGVLLGSPRIEDYPEQPSAYPSRSSRSYTRRSLLYAEKAENVSIVGGGAINGQGSSPAFRPPLNRMKEADRPLLLRFSECRNVRLRDVTLRNSAMWVQNYLACDNVSLDGVTIDSQVNNNNDGIDIDDCWNVRVTNCDIRSGDDAICLKSTSSRGCRNVVVSNCIVTTHCSAFKLGTDSTGGFQDITLTNCAFYDTGLAGIAIECVDGGLIERVLVSNVAMKNVMGPIFVRLGNRGRGMEQPVAGKLRNVTITSIDATGASGVGSSITGVPGAPAQDLTLERIRIRSQGGGKPEHVSREVGEYPNRYPEYCMFGPSGKPSDGQLPAHGIYARHVSGLSLRDVDLRCDNPDARPALVFDDVNGVNLFDIRGTVEDSAPGLVWMKQVSGALVHGCRAPKGLRTFLRVDGAGPGDVVLLNNDLAQAATAVEKGNSVPGDAVVSGANRMR
jgi:hypothetical protein